MVINVGKKINEPDMLDFASFPAAYRQMCIRLGHHPAIMLSFTPRCASYPSIISATLTLTSTVFETTEEPALQRCSSILFQRPN